MSWSCCSDSTPSTHEVPSKVHEPSLTSLHLCQHLHRREVCAHTCAAEVEGYTLIVITWACIYVTHSQETAGHVLHAPQCIAPRGMRLFSCSAHLFHSCCALCMSECDSIWRSHNGVAAVSQNLQQQVVDDLWGRACKCATDEVAHSARLGWRGAMDHPASCSLHTRASPHVEQDVRHRWRESLYYVDKVIQLVEPMPRQDHPRIITHCFLPQHAYCLCPCSTQTVCFWVPGRATWVT